MRKQPVGGGGGVERRVVAGCDGSGELSDHRCSALSVDRTPATVFTSPPIYPQPGEHSNGRMEVFLSFSSQLILLQENWRVMWGGGEEGYLSRQPIPPTACDCFLVEKLATTTTSFSFCHLYILCRQVWQTMEAGVDRHKLAFKPIKQNPIQLCPTIRAIKSRLRR